MARCPSDSSDLVQAGHYTAFHVIFVGWKIYGCATGLELATLPERGVHKPRVTPAEPLERPL